MRVAVLVIAVVLSGCAGSEQGSRSETWKVTSARDQFTDSTTTLLTVGDFSTSSGIYTRSLRYYPFVGMQSGELVVGLRSGGAVRVPTGTVQLRIDGNPAWTIGPEETPVFLAPQHAIASVKTGDAKVDASISAVQQQAMAAAAKTMSPFTAATGDKARQILTQMLRGQKMIYRTVGLNQAASTTGEVLLDGSFAAGVTQLGVDVDALLR